MKNNINVRNEIKKNLKINLIQSELIKINAENEKENTILPRTPFRTNVLNLNRNYTKNKKTLILKKLNIDIMKDNNFPIPIYKLKIIDKNNFNKKGNLTTRKILNIKDLKNNANSISIRNKSFSRIKLISTSSLSNSFEEEKKLFLKSKLEPKKYLRKLDIDINSLILSKKKNMKINKALLSEDNRKVRIHNLINDLNLEKHKLYIYGNENGRNNNFIKINNEKPKYSDITHLQRDIVKSEYLDNALNSITRNITFLNNKNNTISNKKAINLLKEEKTKFNKTMKNFNKKGKMYPYANSKYSIDDTSSKRSNINDYKLFTTMGDLRMDGYNHMDKITLNKKDKLKNLIYKNLILSKGSNNLKIFEKNNYDNYIDPKIDTNMSHIYKFHKNYFLHHKNKIMNYHKPNEHHIHQRHLKMFSNAFTNIEKHYFNLDFDDKSVKSLPEVKKMKYRHKVMKIFDRFYAPKTIIKNNKKIKIVYLNFNGDEDVPCYENGKEILDENILLKIYLKQKENERIKNFKNISQMTDNESSDDNNYSNNEEYKEDIQNFYNYINNKNKTKKEDKPFILNKKISKTDNNNIKNLNGSIFNKIAIKKKNLNNDISNLNIEFKSNKNISNISQKNSKTITINKSNKKKEKSKDKDNQFEEVESEEENYELNEILNSDDSLKESLIDQNNNNGEMTQIKITKLKNQIEKAALHAVLFLKQKSQQIDDKKTFKKLLKNKNFKRGISYIKSKIEKNKDIAKNIGIITNSKESIEDNIIDYYYKMFTNEVTPYHKVLSGTESYLRKINWQNISQFKNYKSVFSLLKKEEQKERNKKLKKLSLINKQMISDLKRQQLKYEEEKKKQMLIKEKELEKKRKKIGKAKIGFCYGLFKQEEEEDRKIAIINEISLTNELNYQIRMAKDDDNRERFKYLLEQIHNLKKLDENEYINSIKENYNNLKGEIKDLVHAKEMEERINKFIKNLILQREKNTKNKTKLENQFSVKDCIFQTSVIDISNTNNNI